jgi:hypothetical protein
MSASQFYPPVVTQYDEADRTPNGLPYPLGLTDTTSLFNLNGGTPRPGFDVRVPYVLPGLPYNVATTPNGKKLMANLSTGGSAVILAPDWALLPVPQVADFRSISFFSVGDFAVIYWTGMLWSLVDLGGPTAGSANATQTVPQGDIP